MAVGIGSEQQVLFVPSDCQQLNKDKKITFLDAKCVLVFDVFSVCCATLPAKRSQSSGRYRTRAVVEVVR